MRRADIVTEQNALNKLVNGLRYEESKIDVKGVTFSKVDLTSLKRRQSQIKTLFTHDFNTIVDRTILDRQTTPEVLNEAGNERTTSNIPTYSRLTSLFP